jgi:metallophosphoesterase (TIGR00282 family)
VNLLFIGDIIGDSGRKIAKECIPSLKEEYAIDVTIANGENSAGGFGLVPQVVDELYKMGIDVITTGNHVWDKKEIFPLIDTDKRLLRPINYPEGVAGRGSVIISLKNNLKVAVINVSGRVYMNHLECPFKTTKAIVENIRKETQIIIIDFHAEVTSEKNAFAWFLDGSVSAIIGTHTHVPTADERVFPCGTAYITDVGMTGSSDSVIGIKKELALRRFLLQIPTKFEVAKGNLKLCAVYVKIDDTTGKAIKIERIVRETKFL